MKTAAFAMLVFFIAQPAMADEISGKARVIDGDTIIIQNRRIRLDGIDAPELRQTCHHDGQEWACGVVATRHLKSLIGRQRVSCDAHGLDRYGRALANCQTQAHADLGGEMVSSGMAIAYRRYSTRYVKAEEKARQTGLGLWSGNFMPPEEWRHR